MARKRRKSKLALPVGILTVILAIVGLVTVINGCISFAKSRADNEAGKAKYEEFLKPVVMFNPDPFDDLTQADNSQLLYCAVWNLLQDEEGMSKYSYSQGETFGIQVPQEDIENSFIYLFGTEIDIASLHGSIDMSMYDITYDAALKSYILPITGIDSAYVPEVTDIQKQGNSLVLTVGYIGTKAWADLDEDGYSAPEADKWMKITLRESNNDSDIGYYVASIQETDEQEAVTSATTYYEDVTAAETETAEETESEVQYSAEYAAESTSAYETVTDENGETVTDENGEAVTSVIADETLSSEAAEETGESA